MKIDVQNSSGKVVESIKLDSNVFNIEMKSSVVRQAVLAELSNLRQGTHSSKNSEQSENVFPKNDVRP